MSKQTAVEWLIDQIVNHNGVNSKTFEQAKAMEREQIEEAFWDGCKNWDNDKQAIDYYIQTYKGGEQ